MQLFGVAAYAGSAGNDGHAIGVFQLVHGLFQLGAFVTLNATRNTAAPRVVGHEHHIAACQTDEGGKRCAFIAAFFFFYLDKEVLPLFDDFLNARLRRRDIAAEVLFRDFFKRQKTVPVFAVIDKAGFKRGLDAGDHGFIDIALALLAPFNLGFVIEELLPLNYGQTAFFRLGGVNQHALHGMTPSL